MKVKDNLLKYIAYKNVTKKINDDESFEQFLIRWWSQKYKLPDNDTRLLSKSLEELAVEYYEDKFINNPQELKAYEQGYDSLEEADEAWLKEEMGDEYHEDVDYYDNNHLPPDIEENFNLDTIGED